ncbi:MAG: hypothetical protein ISS45_05905 [Candidatus Omnitrophica bacterium]|nr:hypothetical protein [Candidatus Omnitrophota bacterium]
MVSFPPQNYIVYSTIENFKIQDKELDFGDFNIISVKQGSEAAEWRRKLGCKGVPTCVLIRDYPNYRMQDDDFSGFDGIINSMRDLLLTFRLFKVGDIIFGDYLIEDKETKDSFFNRYSSEKPSLFKYQFEQKEIEAFNNFRRDLTNKIGYRNNYFNFALDYFMSGIDKGFFYRVGNLGRIVDHVMALESLFLIDNKMHFLRRTIAERIAKFLEDNTAKKIVKYIYDIRSNIVHGNYIDLREEKWAEEKRKIQPVMERFEHLIRKVIVRLFDFNFSNKKSIVKFMEGLYDIPSDALKIMQSAKLEADKIFKISVIKT